MKHYCDNCKDEELTFDYTIQDMKEDKLVCNSYYCEVCFQEYSIVEEQNE